MVISAETVSFCVFQGRIFILFMHFAGQAMCATESLAADFSVAEISAGASRYNYSTV